MLCSKNVICGGCRMTLYIRTLITWRCRASGVDSILGKNWLLLIFRVFKKDNFSKVFWVTDFLYGQFFYCQVTICCSQLLAMQSLSTPCCPIFSPYHCHVQKGVWYKPGRRCLVRTRWKGKQEKKEKGKKVKGVRTRWSGQTARHCQAQEHCPGPTQHITSLMIICILKYFVIFRIF